ncbi:hypothetical protein AB0J90_26785 [Micromonospora sp. NPDC049523]|uniref:hypothetical protein n=1 Tax=Micromonospora sp. NPDC049523 TaxID=3155921 RepID=UPI003434F053
MRKFLPRRLGLVLTPVLVVVLAVGTPAYAAQAGGPTGATITTRLVSRATDLPVPNICVFATPVLSFSWPDLCPARSDADGRVQVEVSAAGAYNLFVLPDSGSRYGAQWVGPDGGTGSQKTARRITLDTGETTPVPKIKLDDRATIVGQRRPGPGPQIVNGTVGIVSPTPDNRRDLRYSPIADDGSFRIDWLGPYEWPLLFKSDQHPYQWSGQVGNRLLADLVPATVGATEPYLFRLSSGTYVGVRIPDEPPGPLRLLMRNVVTGEVVAVGEDDDASHHVRPMVLGGQQVKWECLCPSGVRWHGGTDFASATPVVIHTMTLPYLTFEGP